MNQRNHGRGAAEFSGRLCRGEMSKALVCPLRKSPISLALSLMVVLSVPMQAVAQASGGVGFNAGSGGAGGMAGAGASLNGGDGQAGTGGANIEYSNGTTVRGLGVGGAGGKGGTQDSPSGEIGGEVGPGTMDSSYLSTEAVYEDTVAAVGRTYGGGGGGGAGYSNFSTDVSIIRNYVGGKGGAGGAMDDRNGAGRSGAGGGGGGAGGDGLRLISETTEIISGIEIVGGAGGAGGRSAHTGGRGDIRRTGWPVITFGYYDSFGRISGGGGAGGQGGAGVKITAKNFNNFALVKGGAGGAGGAVESMGKPGAGGNGGTGLVFEGGFLSNGGRVQGGPAGNAGYSPHKNGGRATPTSVAGPGSGGVGIFFIGESFENSGAVAGGDGGSLFVDGRRGRVTLAKTDGAGYGGHGVVFAGEKFLNSGEIRGGDGGGGNERVNNNGGDGVVFSAVETVINAGSIQGGASGLASGTPTSADIDSVGGVGLRFSLSGVHLVNSGLIQGGVYKRVFDRNAVVGFDYYDAVRFSGGNNRLEIHKGSQIIGNVIASNAVGDGFVNTFSLGGTEGSDFDVSDIGMAAKYRGFTHYEKTGVSNWSLTGATGTTTPWAVNEGVLSVAADASLGSSAGTLTLNGGALAVTGRGFSSTERNLVLGVQGGSIDIVDTQNNFIVSQAITGSGGLEKAGAGRLTLMGGNDYAGTTTISAGTLALGAGGRLTAAGNVNLASDAARLDLSQASAQTIGALTGVAGSVVDLGSNALTLGDAADQHFAGVVNGSGSVVKQGSGRMVFSGDNRYSGGTTIAAGTLQLGDGGTVGNLTGNVHNDGTLAFNRSNENIFAGNISGSGAVRQVGSGTTVLTGANSYQGNTVVSGGMLQFGAATGGSNQLGGDISVNAAALAINMPATLAVAGQVDFSAGSTLSMHDRHDGTVLFSADRMKIADNVKFNLAGISNTQGVDEVLIRTSAGIQGDFSKVTVGGAAGDVDYLTFKTYKSDDGKQYLAKYALKWAAGENASNNFTLTESSNQFTVDTPLSDQPAAPAEGTSLTKSGAGTLVLSANNGYSGGTAISAGTLQLGDGGTTGSIIGKVDNNGTLAIKRSDAVTIAGDISGSGAFAQIGTGTTTLAGKNSYTGTTRVAAGTLVAGSESALVQNSAYQVESGATLDLNNHALKASSLTGSGTVALGTAVLTVNTDTRTEFGGALQGEGRLVKEGTGTLALTGASTMTGGVALRKGRVDLGNAQGLGTGVLSMDDGTAIVLTTNGMVIANDLRMTGSEDPIIDTGANDATWSGAISGAGFLTKLGTGSLTLTSRTNDYTGVWIQPIGECQNFCVRGTLNLHGSREAG